MLLKQVEAVLEKGGFDYCLTEGCFDIAARRDFTLFMKVLGNVDSLQEEQANNLKILSTGFDAVVAVVGTHTRREMLMDNVIYDRFDIPTFTPDTLESIVVKDEFPSLYRNRGGIFVDIDPNMLRTGRQNSGLSQRELAEKAGVTKKSIYEHERARKKALHETARRLEKIVGKVSGRAVLNFEYAAKSEPKGAFEKRVVEDFNRIGFSAETVHQSPFNVLAKGGNTLILSKADESKKRIERSVKQVSDIAELTEKTALVVTKDKIDLGIPAVREDELRTLNAKDLKKLLK